MASEELAYVSYHEQNPILDYTMKLVLDFLTRKENFGNHWMIYENK